MATRWWQQLPDAPPVPEPDEDAAPEPTGATETPMQPEEVAGDAPDTEEAEEAVPDAPETSEEAEADEADAGEPIKVKKK